MDPRASIASNVSFVVGPHIAKWVGHITRSDTQTIWWQEADRGVRWITLLCSEVYCGGAAVKVNIMMLDKLKRKCVQFTLYWSVLWGYSFENEYNNIMV